MLTDEQFRQRCDRLKLPEQTRQFVEPIGIGTSNTESLSSYLFRLAQEHCVTPHDFVGKCTT